MVLMGSARLLLRLGSGFCLSAIMGSLVVEAERKPTLVFGIERRREPPVQQPENVLQLLVEAIVGTAFVTLHATKMSICCS